MFCRIGYIPISADDTHYKQELAQEISEKFPPCDCSNCKPAEAEAIISKMQQINNKNFDAFLKDPCSIPKDDSISVLVRTKKKGNGKPKCPHPKR